MNNLMREHEFLSNLVLAESADTGELVGGIIKDGRLQKESVGLGPLCCDQRLRNVFLAAPLMYRTLSLQYKALQEFINLSDKLPKDSDLAMLQPSFIDMQNGILLAQKMAQEGIEQGSKCVDVE